MILKKWLVLGASLMITASVLTGTTVLADETGVAQINSDPLNETVSDEKLTVAFMSEPSTLWGPGTGKLENEDVYVASASSRNLEEVETFFKDFLYSTYFFT